MVTFKLTSDFVAKTYPFVASSTKGQTPKSSLSDALSLSLPPSMETFSSSVSALKVPSLPPTHHEFHHFKGNPFASPSLPPHAHVYVSSASKPNLIPSAKPVSHKGSSSLVFSSSSSSSQAPSSGNPVFYRKPATGYAAAAIDVAQSSDSLHLVQRDVQRLLGFLRNENFEEPARVRALVGQGGFHRNLVALVKMLLKKNRIGMVKEVLEEFERIYDELCGTQVVLVSSATRMGEDQLFGIAENVQRMSGAVKIKVRNLIRESPPSFAV